MNLLLSDAERRRFADWLEHEAETGSELVRQLELLPGIPTGMVNRQRAEASAAALIAAKLRATESSVIEGPSA